MKPPADNAIYWANAPPSEVRPDTQSLPSFSLYLRLRRRSIRRIPTYGVFRPVRRLKDDSGGHLPQPGGAPYRVSRGLVSCFVICGRMDTIVGSNRLQHCADPPHRTPPPRAEIEGSIDSKPQPCALRTVGKWNHGRGRGRDPYKDVLAPLAVRRNLMVEGIQGCDGEALCNARCMILQGTLMRSS